MGDIRLQTGFLDNPKVLKLKRRHGAEAILSLIKFWFYVAENKPTGKLTNVDQEDIDIVCGEHAFSMHDAMLELGFLHKTANGYKVHDWEKNQPWLCSAPKRKENAVNAAKARWNKKKPEQKQKVKRSAACMLAAYDEHPESNAPYLTLPNQTLPNLTIPNHLANSVEFAKVWMEWEAYRASIGKKITEHGASKQFKQLGKLTAGGAVECIEISIMNGYQGLFPEKVKDMKQEKVIVKTPEQLAREEIYRKVETYK